MFDVRKFAKESKENADHFFNEVKIFLEKAMQKIQNERMLNEMKFSSRIHGSVTLDISNKTLHDHNLGLLDLYIKDKKYYLIMGIAKGCIWYMIPRERDIDFIVDVKCHDDMIACGF